MTNTEHYTTLAWCSGDAALQRGWWLYVQGELRRLEKDEPGIEQEVLDALGRLRAAQQG